MLGWYPNKDHFAVGKTDAAPLPSLHIGVVRAELSSSHVAHGPVVNGVGLDFAGFVIPHLSNSRYIYTMARPNRFIPFCYESPTHKIEYSQWPKFRLPLHLLSPGTTHSLMSPLLPQPRLRLLPSGSGISIRKV
jgi:hypothetical protein